MISRMADTVAPAAPAPPADQDQDQDQAPGTDWGRVLDVMGIGAGILLVVIVADIWTDGRLISRRLLRRPRQDGEPVDQTGQ